MLFLSSGTQKDLQKVHRKFPWLGHPGKNAARARPNLDTSGEYRGNFAEGSRKLTGRDSETCINSNIPEASGCGQALKNPGNIPEPGKIAVSSPKNLPVSARSTGLMAAQRRENLCSWGPISGKLGIGKMNPYPTSTSQVDYRFFSQGVGRIIYLNF